MATHVGEQFNNVHVVLDGEQFSGCTFTRCRIVYRAATPATIAGNTFDACGYEFEGPAANTIHFLRDLYHATGPQGPKLIEQVFESIRQPPDAGTGDGVSPTPPGSASE